MSGMAQQVLDEAPKALIAALIPAFQLLWKWFKNRDLQARKDALRTRIVQLADQKGSLAKVHELPHGNELVDDLDKELTDSMERLATLRVAVAAPPKNPSDRPFVARLFLLFAPSGFLAWTLHTLFFVNVAILGFGLIGVLADWGEDPDSPYGLLGLAIFAIPAFVFRAIAIKIAKAQTQRPGIA